VNASNKHQISGGGSVLYLCYFVGVCLLKQQSGYQWLPTAKKRRKPLFGGCVPAKTAKRL
jgi:hypothetical protein